MKDSDDAIKKNAAPGNEGELNDKDLDGVAAGVLPGFGAPIPFLPEVKPFIPKDDTLR